MSGIMMAVLNNNIAAAIPFDPVPVTSGLQLYLDAASSTSYSGSGTTWYDLSGNQNDVVMQNSSNISFTRSSGSYFTLANNGYFNKATTAGVPTGSSSYTLCAWIQLGSSWGSNGIIGVGSAYGSGNSVNAFRTSGTNTLLNYWWANDFSAVASLSPATQWFNCVAQWDGTTRRIWVNGTEIGSAAASGLNVTTSLVQIGGTNTNGSESLRGNIGQVLIYNRALSSTEIQDNYNAIKTRYGV